LENTKIMFDRKKLTALIFALSVTSLMLSSLSPPVSAAPSGKNFDHIVMIAMENQNYQHVFGDGTGTSSAPFLSSLLPYGTTIPNYHSYGAGAFAGDSVNGCSAGCYVALLGGSDYGISDGYSCCITGTTLVDQMETAGLTWQAYCENGCPRGNDHFAFTGFAGSANSPDVFSDSSVNTGMFISSANSANPPNLLWYTPTDGHNMHDNSISTGDSYLKTFLVGTGSFQSPASGSLLASSLFTSSSYRTLLYIWWDEYDPSPNIQLGFGGASVKRGYVSTSDTYDEFATLHTIEDNWSLGALSSAADAPVTSDVFGTSPGQPSQPPNNQPGSGGTCIICSLTDLAPALSLLAVGLVVGGGATATIFFARNHAHNRRLSAMLARRETEARAGVIRQQASRRVRSERLREPGYR